MRTILATWTKFFTLVLMEISCSSSVDPPGHLKPLGSHMPPINVEVSQSVPDPVEFFHNYVKPSRPLVMQNAAKKFGNFEKWKDDEYLMRNFGRWFVTVEIGKYEGSVFGRDVEMSFEEFLERYRKKDYYLIQQIEPENPMRKDISLLRAMACGGYSELISEVLLLFSSGSTKSALHWDDVENIHCVFDGTKEWVLYHQDVRGRIPKMESHKAYSAVDCRSVDMYKYPVFQQLPWYHAFINEGDCLYLPAGWPHHVKSEGNQRNMAMATWFGPISRLNTSDCPDDMSVLPETIAIGTKLMKDRDRAQNLLFGLLEDRDKISKDDFMGESLDHPLGNDELLKIFAMIDVNTDGFISSDEVAKIPDDVVRDVKFFHVVDQPYLEVEESGNLKEEL